MTTALDRKTLTEYVTGTAGASLLRRAVTRDAEGNAVLTDNAKGTLLGARAKVSESSARGFLYVCSRDFFDLMDEMMDRDPAIASAIGLVVAFVENREITLEVDDENDEAALAVRDAVQRHVLGARGHFGFNQLVATLAAGALSHGLSVSEIIWQLVSEDGRDLLVPASFIQRHPGQFGFDEMGRPYTVSGVGKTPTAAPPYKFAIMRMPGKYGDPFGESAIYGIRWYYGFKKSVFASWVEFADTFGTPLAKTEIGREVANQEALRDDLEEQFADLRTKNTIIYPEGVKIDFTPRDGGGQSNAIFAALIQWIERSMVRAILGSTLSTMENEGTGSLAQSKTHADTSEARTRPVARALEDALQRGVVEPFVRLNFGEAAPVPNIRVDTDGSIDTELAIKILDTAVNWDIDIVKTQAREWLGLRQPGEGEETLRRTFSALGSTVSPVNPPPDLPPDDAQEFAEKRGAPSRTAERDFSITLETAARQAAEEARAELASGVMDALSKLGKKLKDHDGPMPAGAAKLAGYKPKVKEWPMLRTALTVAKALAAGVNAAHLTRALPKIFREDAVQFASASAQAAVDGLPSEFRDAAQWMLERKIMTVAEVRRLASALALLSPERTAEFFEAQLRREIFAISAAANEQVAERFNSALAAAVRDGRSFAEFYEVAQSMMEAGSLPLVGDGYIENVFRTETANMYERQRESQLQDPDLDEFYWGDQLFNRNTPGSRETHRAIDGLMLRRGSEAYEASRPGPPWSYQCTCTRAPVIVADVKKAGFSEPDDALALVRSIVRFDSEA